MHILTCTMFAEEQSQSISRRELTEHVSYMHIPTCTRFAEVESQTISRRELTQHVSHMLMIICLLGWNHSSLLGEGN